MHLDSLNWTEKTSFQYADADPGEQLEDLLVLLHVDRQHVLVKVGQADHQRVPICVFHNAASEVRDGPGIEALCDSLAPIDVLHNRELVLKMRLRLPLCLD